MTTPLGYLQRYHQSLFNPQLSKIKQESLSSLHMGLLNKICLEFPRQWWPKDFDFFFLSTLELSGQQGVLLVINQASMVQSPVLVCHIASEHARYLESFKDEEVLDKVMKLFRKTFKECGEIPWPTWMDMTRWGQDSFTFGSYSVRYNLCGFSHSPLKIFRK